MAVVEERERIAGRLLDNVIQRVSLIGLSLTGTAGLAMTPEARRRVEEAADGLDDVNRAIRAAVYDQRYPRS